VKILHSSDFGFSVFPFSTHSTCFQFLEKPNKTIKEMPAELESDYEKNPTHLYMLIQQRDWEGVQYQAGHFPEEVKTYVFRKEADGLVKWRLLPLHASILNEAPLAVLQDLLSAFPDSAKAQDDRGMLPIHLAIKKHVAPDAINLLLASYPECIDVENVDGMTPYKMSKTSNSAHKQYYQRALKRGSPTNSAVTGSMADLFCGVHLPTTMSTDPRTGFGLLAS
jgi:hypothetical protein